MNYIKKLTIQVEDSNGRVWDTEIDGLQVKEITVERPLREIDPLERFHIEEPDVITITMLAFGGISLGNVGVRNQKNITPEPKQLNASAKQLLEHEE